MPSNNEIDAVELLMAGDADMTVVRAGAVQQLGADSLAPLGAPFVVTNNDQAAAIAADASIQEAVLADLDEMGLVGAGAGARRPPAPVRVRRPSRCSAPATTTDQFVNVRRDAGVVAILEGAGCPAGLLGRQRADQPR